MEFNPQWGHSIFFSKLYFQLKFYVPLNVCVTQLQIATKSYKKNSVTDCRHMISLCLQA